MGHTKVSAWQYGAKVNNCNFELLNSAVVTKTRLIQMGQNTLNVGLKMNLPIIIF